LRQDADIRTEGIELQFFNIAVPQRSLGNPLDYLAYIRNVTGIIPQHRLGFIYCDLGIRVVSYFAQQ
jgi:hypothetical protein